ncbi:MAG TPA: aminotransferase class V-fold PLP-dependent enzyme [Bryobacterales bacterium]|nr:aminotransferase class V-fold PLP-dependent enzyme [Bryobacterales bacterium]
MSSNRRGFLQSLVALPGVGGVLGGLLPASLVAKPSKRDVFMKRDVYKELGIRPLINAAGTYTVLSASLIPREAVDAIESASRQYVNLIELQEAVGKKIAALIGSEAALVSAGAASALTLGTAACVAGKDQEKIRRLPDTTGMKNEVIIQKSHRYGYDHAIRNVGIKFVEVETPAELESAANERTAMMMFLNENNNKGQIKDQEFAQLGKKLNVPTFIDAAADCPPVENLTKFLKLGFSLVTFSGGKGLRGPQCSGLLLGRQDLIEAALLNNNPYSDSVARTNKVGKEELVGMWVALEHFLKQDHQAVWRDWEKRCKTIADLVTPAQRSVKTEVFVPEIANAVPHLRITWDFTATGLSPHDVVKQLRDGEPRIEVRPGAKEAIEVAVSMLEPGEEQIVGRRLREILKKAA